MCTCIHTHVHIYVSILAPPPGPAASPSRLRMPCPETAQPGPCVEWLWDCDRATPRHLQSLWRPPVREPLSLVV